MSKPRECRYCGAPFLFKNSRALCCSVEHAKLWAKENRKVTTSEENFLRHLRNDHNLSVVGYNEMLSLQQNDCVLCFKPLTGKVCIDHDHGCCPQGKSCARCRRGVIHNACNLILGHAKDDPILLRQAAQYLEMHNEEV
jgi:hypothetical protein